MTTKKCRRCGNNIPADAHYCPYCGEWTDNSQVTTNFVDPDATQRIFASPPVAIQRQTRTPVILIIIIVLLALLLGGLVGFLMLRNGTNGTTNGHTTADSAIAVPIIPEKTTPETVYIAHPQRTESQSTTNEEISLTGSHTLYGDINGQYPVTARIHIGADGRITGKYAYNITLKRAGDKPESWIKLDGYTDGESFQMSQVCPGVEEPWDDIRGSIYIRGNRLHLDGSWWTEDSGEYTFNVSSR